MKSDEFTVSNAMAWDKQMLIAELTKPENRGRSCNKCILKALEDPFTMYYSDAPKLAIVEYFHKKHFETNSPFKVTMKVRLLDGKVHMYSVFINDIKFDCKDLCIIVDELVHPTAKKLVKEAAGEIKFEDVDRVVAYVTDEGV